MKNRYTLKQTAFLIVLFIGIEFVILNWKGISHIVFAILLLITLFLIAYINKKMQVFRLTGLLFGFLLISYIVAVQIEEHHLASSGILVIGEVINSEHTYAGRCYIKYSYRINGYNNTDRQKVDCNFSNQITRKIMLRISQRRPWISEIIDLDSTEINKLINNNSVR